MHYYCCLTQTTRIVKMPVQLYIIGTHSFSLVICQSELSFHYLLNVIANDIVVHVNYEAPPHISP